MARTDAPDTAAVTGTPPGTGTVHLHRVLRAPPSRVYRAFTDAAALVKWLPPHGFTGTMHEFDARVGGGYRMSFTNLGTGGGHSFRVTYLELVPDERIVHTDAFDSAGLPGEMRVTVTFAASVAGTELRIEQAGIPEAIPIDFCYQGWQDSLALLAQLVEPEIPDGA
ncbi:SRPBCC family protein [Luteimonas abyssi]|uniref:SRPBCC family protein n=1 Tax=Luteimonas abyssi TaxID=1247514 RepID=UPI000737D1A1|nr:SRPBCC family protein [Luteimonas abyssi]